MDDLTLISIGRQFVEFSLQKEQLFRALQEAQRKLEDISKLKTSTE